MAEQDPGDQKVLDAEAVYLIMTKEHRISRHLRAKWYLEHVNKVLKFPYPDQKPGHPQLVSVFMKDSQPLELPEGSHVLFKLGTDTTVNFLSTHHDIVFAIDVSFSAISSASANTEVLFDRMYEALANTIVGLSKPFIVPGTRENLFVPYLYVTVIAYCPLENCPVQQVLTHGYLVTHNNVNNFVNDISMRLGKFENEVAKYMEGIVRKMESRISRTEEGVLSFSLYSNEAACDDTPTLSLRNQHLSPDMGFFHLLKNAMLAVSLLPENCSGGIIVITDGNVGIGDVGRYDNLLIQLLSKSCTCSIIEVQPTNDPVRGGLGRIAHSEMLRFIATATFGAYFSETPSMGADQSQKMNVYHEGVLCWDFKKSIKEFTRPDISSLGSVTFEKKMARKHDSYELCTPLHCIITTRLKEGFTIKKVNITKDNYMEVIMVMPWRKNISIEYRAVSIWPVPPLTPNTRVEVWYEGTYHFLHDLLCRNSQTNKKTASKYRQSVVQRFWKSILSLRATDDCLQLLQSFHTETVHRTIPENIKKGISVFFRANPTADSEALEVSNLENDQQFAFYWRSIICMDLGMPLDKFGPAFDRSSHVFEKWFHITRLYLVLEHDPELPELLQVPYSNDRYRYNVVQYRQAFTALTRKLAEWADFVMLENSHYVKYIHRRSDDTTQNRADSDDWLSYCLIMMSVKAACVSLRLMFLGGTDSTYRARFIDDLKTQLRSLHFPKRQVAYVTNSKGKKRRAEPPTAEHRTPLQKDWDERQCCVLLTKPLDRVLIRYERVPKNFLTVDGISSDIAPMPAVISRLSNYLHHQRWVWSLRRASDEALSIRTVGKVLDLLTKVRLQEGFHFAQTSSGIVYMTLQADMVNCDDGTASDLQDEESLSCLIQYITFPPQYIKDRDSCSDSDHDEDMTESHAELFLVTECWVEPQHGYVARSTPERDHYQDCTFSQWPDKLFPVDYSCIMLLTSFEHLLNSCSPVGRQSTCSSSISAHTDKGSRLNEGLDKVCRVKQIPFKYSLIEMLKKCPQVEMLFSTYKMDHSCPNTHNLTRNHYKANEILFDKLMEHFEKVAMEPDKLTEDECLQFMQQVKDRRELNAEPLPFTIPTQERCSEQPGTCINEKLSASLPGSSATLHSEQTLGSLADLQSLNCNLKSSWRCFCIRPNQDELGQITIVVIPSSFEELSKMSCHNDDLDETMNFTDELAQGNAHRKESSAVHITPRGSDRSASRSSMKAHILPIYVYQCSRASLTDALVNRWTNHATSDIYQDLKINETKLSARDNRSSVGEETTRRPRRRTESSSQQRFLERSKSLDLEDEMQQFCRQLKDTFYKCFLSGIFHSLQSGYAICSDDIDSAIHSICEESTPIEIQITEFLAHICSHLSHPLASASECTGDQVFAESSIVSPQTVKQVRFEPADEEENRTIAPRQKSNSGHSDSGRTSSLRSPYHKILCKEIDGRLCSSPDLFQQLKEKFVSVISAWFKPIPSCPEYLYYCPPSNRKHSLVRYASTLTDDTDGEMFNAYEEDFAVQGQPSTSPFDYSDITESNDSAGEWTPPLFVQLIATIGSTAVASDRNPIEPVSVPVESLPLCIAELKECFKDKEFLDIANLNITLDIICLTLPSDQDENDSPYLESLDEGNNNTEHFYGTGIEKNLPETQVQAVNSCKQQIEWLVKDVIVSAVRRTGPITPEVLEMVATHIKSTRNKPSCIHNQVPLDYVFGHQKSHAMFMEEFKLMNIKGFKLVSQGDYFYLTYDRYSAVPPELLNCALNKITKIRQSSGGSNTSSKDGQEFLNGSESMLEPCSNDVNGGRSHNPAGRTVSCPDKIDGNTFLETVNGFNSGILKDEQLESEGSIQVIADEAADGTDIFLELVESQEATGSSPLHSGLSSLPKRDAMEAWPSILQDDEEVCIVGSLPKALSSSNVNEAMIAHERNLDTDMVMPAYDRRARHVSEDAGRKQAAVRRATFAVSVRSPPTHSPLMSMCGNDALDTGSPRSRNTSGGPWTPRSCRNIKTGSTGSGYDGDMSDEEMGEGISLSDSGHSFTPRMPNFWIILQVDKDKVDALFHTNELNSSERRRFLDGPAKQIIFKQVSESIKSTCKLVNQRLLLQDLNERHKCSPLLEEEESWEADYKGVEKKGKKPETELYMDDDEEDAEQYLAARTKFVPGHFRCDCKWEKIFKLHPRLKTGPSRNVCRGINAMKTALGLLAVENRTNMFVYKQPDTGYIYYLRLSELTDKDDFDDDERSTSQSEFSLKSPSRSSSVRSLSRMRGDNDSPRRASVSEKDDAISISSRISKKSLQHEGVKLSVHGIYEVGHDLRIHFTDLLMSKLDSTVLVEIANLLSRNPNCMLTANDVHFIQRRGPPTLVLQWSLPDGIRQHLLAVLHYLRQNLLRPEHFFHPKYQDMSGANRFVDYAACLDKPEPMADSDTFLYNKPCDYILAEKGAGLAVVYLQLVDSSGAPWKALGGCSKPDGHAWSKLTPDLFNRLTTVVECVDRTAELSIASAFVKFSVWSIGEVEPKELKVSLCNSIKYALCDVVCEYYALTAPLCSTPQDVLADAASYAASHLDSSASNRSSAKAPLTPGKERLSKSAVGRSASVFSFADEPTQAKLGVMSPSFWLSDQDLSDQTHALSSSASAGAIQPAREVDSYRHGEKGHLLPFFTSTLVEWLEYCHSIGVPALSRFSCRVFSDCIVGPVMKELENVIKRDVTGVCVQAFHPVNGSYVPCHTSRAPNPEEDNPELCGELQYTNWPLSHLSAGQILVIRNRQLWLQSVSEDWMGDQDGVLSASSIPRGNKNNQKFQPVVVCPASAHNASEPLSINAERVVLPRQLFLMIMVKAGELVLYAYNVIDEPYLNNLKLSALRIARWYNARFHLLNCLALQKMGLFHHVSIPAIPPEDDNKDNKDGKEKKDNKDKENEIEKEKGKKNVFTTNFHDVENLIRLAHPPVVNRAQAPRTKNVPSVCLDQVYRNCKPTRPMHLSKAGKDLDPFTRHGNQLIETFSYASKEMERNQKLERLYHGWQQRVGPITEISEDELELLRSSSRIVHHVATPLLLSPYWRRLAMNFPRKLEEAQQEAERLDERSNKSRHGSGASSQSFRLVTDRSDSPLSHQAKQYDEELWHIEIRNLFVNNYIDYLRQPQQPLEQLGFTPIKLGQRQQQVAPKGMGHHRRSSGGSKQLVKTTVTHSLQQTMMGGIFLVELSFQEVYFVVKLYAFNALQLPSFKTELAREIVPVFINMCDRMRDNTHCHSFAHDFHLRYAHRFIKTFSQDAIKASREFDSNYHLVRMLNDFAQYYDQAPMYSRNAVAVKTINTDAAGNPPDKLFSHILHHERQNKMKVITMRLDESDGEDFLRLVTGTSSRYDYALVYHTNVTSQSELQTSSRAKCSDYEVGVVVSHDPSAGNGSFAASGQLSLTYFVILVNKIQYPVRVPHSKICLPTIDDGDKSSTDRSSFDRTTSIVGAWLDRVAIEPSYSSSPSASWTSDQRASLPEYGAVSREFFSSRSTHHPAYAFLVDQCGAVKKYLMAIVAEAGLQCRKDSLWEQMRSNMKPKIRRGTTETNTQPDLVPKLFSFSEFEELLQHTFTRPISLYDSRLELFSQMQMSWFKQLLNLLSIKYGDMYRFFSKDDKVWHAVVLIPEMDEPALLLSVDASTTTAKFMLIYREHPEESNDNEQKKAFSDFFNEFINTLCFHMWTQQSLAS